MHALALLLALLLPVVAPAETLPVGPGRIEVPERTGANTDPLPVWSFRAEAWAPGRPVVVVMHGLRRDADRYRDDWAGLAAEAGLLLLVPEFTEAKYPGTAFYNFGGAVDAQGAPRPRSEWSFFALERAVAAAQVAAGATPGGFALYGHSAGAQFVHRYLLLTGAAAAGQVVIANAGSYSWPLLDTAFPAGLAGVAVDGAGLTAAFARPVTLLLGEADTDPAHPSLPKQPWAMAQGGHRFARGWAFFDVARRVAAATEVPFRWQVMTVPGVAHSNAGMAAAALPLLMARQPGP